MASQQSIARLHAQVKTSKLPDSPQPERGQGKSVNFTNLEIDPLLLQERSVAAQGCGRLSRREAPQRLDAPDLMSSIAPTSVPMGRPDFASVAARAAVGHWLARRAQRGGGAPPGPFADFPL